MAHDPIVDEVRANRDAFAKKHNVAVIPLKSSYAAPATLLISPRDRAELPGELSLVPLLRVVELGMLLAGPFTGPCSCSGRE